MEPIIVRRHGGRWSVQDDPSSTPEAEYDTRELAEVAAREKAGESGREVVIDDTGDGLDDTGEPAPAESGGATGGGPSGGPPDDEMPREPQAGL